MDNTYCFILLEYNTIH